MRVIEARNPFNVNHCQLVSHYAGKIGEKANVSPDVLKRAMTAAEVHTIGVLLQIEEKKTHLSIPLCSSQGKAREVSLIQREEEILQDLLKGDPQLAEIIPVILQRHEWYNGTGIQGLKEGEILEEARLLAAADAYVDLATPKSHRYPATGVEVMQRISELSGSEFDPAFVNALSALILKGEKWDAQERAYRFTQAQCFHWLDLGDFYRQSQQADWAIRCYTLSLRTAEEMKDSDLILNALSKLFMVFWSTGDLESAKALLDRVQKEEIHASTFLKQRSLILRGLLEWAEGRKEKGIKILETLFQEFKNQENLIGLFTVLLFLSCLTLLQKPVSPDSQQKWLETHLKWLNEFLNLLMKHDLFDLMIQYRQYALLTLLSGVIHQINPSFCRILLTRMGEPCVPHIEEKLKQMPVNQWIEAIHIELPFSYFPAKVPIKEETRISLLEPGNEPNISMRIFFLGSFKVEIKSHIITEENWPTQKAMKLFAYLVYRHQSAVPDETLLDLFWPDKDEEKARNSLRNALHHVRFLFKDLLDENQYSRFLIRSRKTGTLTLNLSIFVDTEEFENLYSSTVHLVSEKKFDEALSYLKQALSYDRGEFLENIKDEWTDTPRTHFSLSFIKATLLLSRCCLMAKDPEAAELAARQVILKDNLQEEAYHYLIESLLAQNKKTEALKQYQEAIRHLEKELGISVSSSFSPLYEKIVKS
jgi:two-component SAPR family response regulator